MAAALITKLIKDGTGSLLRRRMLDAAGTPDDPLLLAIVVPGKADGSGAVDLEALNQDIVDAIEASTGTLPTGAATDASLGGNSAPAAGDTGASTTNGFLRWLRDKFAAGITLAAGSAVIGKVISAGPDYAASGVTAVSQAFTATGSSGAFVAKAGRDVMLELSGTAVADLQVEVQLDGANWRPLYALDGATQLFRISYASVACAIFLPALPVAGAAYRVTDLTHTSGTVTARLSQ